MDQPGVGRRAPNGLLPNKAGLGEGAADGPKAGVRPGVGSRGGGLLSVGGRALPLGLAFGYSLSSPAAAKVFVSATKPGLGQPKLTKERID